MNALINNMQIINNEYGDPIYVLVPYDKYISNSKNTPNNDDFPIEIVDMIIRNNYSCLKSWRMYLGLTQNELAKKANITQSAYSQLESKNKLTSTQRRKFSQVLNINENLLEI